MVLIHMHLCFQYPPWGDDIRGVGRDDKVLVTLYVILANQLNTRTQRLGLQPHPCCLKKMIISSNRAGLKLIPKRTGFGSITWCGVDTNQSTQT